jgi:hypothetical protein
MQKKYKFTSLILAMLVAVLLTSCGSNIFEGLASKPNTSDAENLNDKLKVAATVEEFTEAKTLAEALIVSDPNNPEGHLGLGKAILGMNNATVTDLGPEFMDLMEQNDEAAASSAYTIIENALKNDDGTDKISSANLRTAADAFNRAAELGATLQGSFVTSKLKTQNSASNALSQINQLARGNSNMLAAVDIVTEVYDITPDEIIKKTESMTTKQCLKAIMDPNNDNDTSDSYKYFSENADAAFKAAGFYEDSENGASEEDVKEITQKGEQIENLYKATYGLPSGNPTTFQYEKNQEELTINSSSPDTNLDDALDWIFDIQN